ncbi:MAG: hypothetical protein IPO92_16105 [Saprospiraceae bacterium]|nr:hypothetical protein [Saprospiraceae bacterium]
MNLRNYINRNQLAKGRIDSLIILGNSKSNFILQLLSESLPYIDIKLKGESDYGAIFKGILTNDRLGNFLTDGYGSYPNDHMKSRRICLPYYLHYGDFVSALGGDPKDGIDIVKIRKLILESNKRIDSAKNEYILAHPKHVMYKRPYSNKWDFASPTLSRYLSAPTVNYYKAVVAYHKALEF